MARSLFRISVLCVVAFLLAAPWSTAAPLQDRVPASPPLLIQLWHQFAALWNDIGCGMDPHGSCRENSTPARDIGCIMDPGGGCGH